MITVDTRGIRELERALGDAKKRLPKEVAIAINRTAKWTTTQISRQVRDELNVKVRDVKKALSQRGKANASKLSTVVQLDKEKRLSLKYFGARQTRRGVTAKVGKKRRRTLIPDGFMGPRPGAVAVRLGGHAYKRTGRGRTPIVKLHGASPWGAYVKNNMRPETVKESSRELQKQIQRRIQFNLFKRGLT